jgi:hypothetical protein
VHSTTIEENDEGFIYWLQGQHDERKVIIEYLKEVLDNVRVIDSPIGAAQATVKIIIQEIEDNVHHEGPKELRKQNDSKS